MILVLPRIALLSLLAGDMKIIAMIIHLVRN